MAYAPGVDLGTLKLIPEASRPNAWVLNAGTATTFTDVSFDAYVPKGVKALLLKWQISWSGDGAADYSYWELRKNGSSETDQDRLVEIGMYYTNLPSGTAIGARGQVTCLCDEDGVIEYRFLAGGTAAGSISLNLVGYWM